MHLIGQRVLLSPLDVSDKELFIQISMCPNMMADVAQPYTYEEALTAFAAKTQPLDNHGNGWLSFGIADLTSAEKLGNIALKIVDRSARTAEVGFMVKQEAQGKGVATEALTLICDFAFTALDLNQLVAICAVSNMASTKVLEKRGFARTACWKKNSLLKGQLVDDYYYELCTSNL